MLATTTLTWTLLITGFAPGGPLQAATSIPGFGSPEACQYALEMVKDGLPRETVEPSMLCLPVDSAKPLPNALQGLHELIHQKP